MAPRVGLYTSIPPALHRPDPSGRDVGAAYQARCIESWRRHGFAVHSVHDESERDRLGAPPEGVNVIFARSDPGRRLPSNKPRLGQIFAAIAADGEAGGCVIANADIVLLESDGLPAWLNAQAAGAIVAAQRIDIARPSDRHGSLYPFGFDLLAFDRRTLGAVGDADMVLGEGWWDYWLPMAAMLAGADLKIVDHPIAIHLQHARGLDEALWAAMGRHFGDWLAGASEAAAAAGDDRARQLAAQLSDRPDPFALAAICRSWMAEHAKPVRAPAPAGALRALRSDAGGALWPAWLRRLLKRDQIRF